MTTKLYTGQGDKGETTIKNCTISKSDPIIKVIGEIDEFQAEIGILKAKIGCNLIIIDLDAISHNCYLLMGYHSGYSDIPLISLYHVESLIDSYQKKCKPHPCKFLSPGDNDIEAQANKCRVKCRRLERLLVKYSILDYLPYINRLSSLFYVLQMYFTKEYSINEKE